MTYRRESLDFAEWQRYLLRTEIRYAIEQGKAFMASDRFEVPGKSEEYIELVVPLTTKVRVYDRIIGVTGGVWHVDVLRVSSITPGATDLETGCLNCAAGTQPTAMLRRGGADPVIVNTLERDLIPAQRGPQSSGALASFQTYRVANGEPATDLVMRVENTSNSAETINVAFVWSEEINDG